MSTRSFNLLKSRRKNELQGTKIDAKPKEREESRKGMETIYITTPMVLGWNPLLSTGVGRKKAG